MGFKEYLKTGVLFLVRYLFLFISNLEKSTSIYDFIMYADNTTWFCNINSIPEVNRFLIVN